jgi:transcriptional regulator GlxA family with amidase domain
VAQGAAVAIDDVAAKSGFGSPARFYACFGQITRLSPSAYRRRMP